MTQPDPRAIAESLSEALFGWRVLHGEGDGEMLCTGCWDRSEHDIRADNSIAEGEPVFWTTPHYETGESDPYCLACTMEDARRYGFITAAQDAAVKQELERRG